MKSVNAIVMNYNEFEEQAIIHTVRLLKAMFAKL